MHNIQQIHNIKNRKYKLATFTFCCRSRKQGEEMFKKKNKEYA